MIDPGSPAVGVIPPRPVPIRLLPSSYIPNSTLSEQQRASWSAIIARCRKRRQDAYDTIKLKAEALEDLYTSLVNEARALTIEKLTLIG